MAEPKRCAEGARSGIKALSRIAWARTKALRWTAWAEIKAPGVTVRVEIKRCVGLRGLKPSAKRDRVDWN